MNILSSHSVLQRSSFESKLIQYQKKEKNLRKDISSKNKTYIKSQGFKAIWNKHQMYSCINKKTKKILKYSETGCMTKMALKLSRELGMVAQSLRFKMSRQQDCKLEASLGISERLRLKIENCRTSDQHTQDPGFNLQYHQNLNQKRDYGQFSKYIWED